MSEATDPPVDDGVPADCKVERDHIPFSKLDNSTTHEGDIIAVISLIWPYSESASTMSLQLCEEEKSSDNTEGHLKVTFAGVAAKKMKGVEIGDSVRISLQGANWEAVKDPGPHDVPWHLRWEHYLKAQIMDENQNLKVSVDGDIINEEEEPQVPETVTAAADQETVISSPRPTKSDLKRPAEDEWDAPINIYDPSYVANAPDNFVDLEDDSSYASSEPVRKRARLEQTQNMDSVPGSYFSAEKHAGTERNIQDVLGPELGGEIDKLLEMASQSEGQSSGSAHRLEMPPPPPPLALLSTNLSDIPQNQGNLPLTPEIRPAPSPVLPLMSPFPELASGGRAIDAFEGVPSVSEGDMILDLGRKDSEVSDSTNFEFEVDESILAQVESSVSAMIESESVVDYSGDERGSISAELDRSEFSGDNEEIADDVGATSVTEARAGAGEAENAIPENGGKNEDQDSLFGSDDESDGDGGENDNDAETQGGVDDGGEPIINKGDANIETPPSGATPSLQSRSISPTTKDSHTGIEDVVTSGTEVNEPSEAQQPGETSPKTAQTRFQKVFQSTGAGSPFPAKLYTSLPTPVSPSGGGRRESFAGLPGMKPDLNPVTPLRRSSIAIPNSVMRDGQMSPVTPSRLFLPEPTPTEDKKGSFSWLQVNHEGEKDFMKRNKSDGDQISTDQLPSNLKVSHSNTFPIRSRSPFSFDKNNSTILEKSHFRSKSNGRAALDSISTFSDEDGDNSSSDDSVGDLGDIQRIRTRDVGETTARIGALRKKLDEYVEKTDIKAGIITPLSEFVSIRDLLWGSTVDVIAINVKHSTVARASSGPRDYYTTLRIVDPSSPLGITVTIFRPFKDALPVVNPGDIVLLRSFRVQSRKHEMIAISTNCSAWGVWRKTPAQSAQDMVSPGGERPFKRRARSVVEGNGPDVEYEDEEEKYIETLGKWWDELPSDISQDLIRGPLDGQQDSGDISIRKRKAEDRMSIFRKRRSTIV